MSKNLDRAIAAWESGKTYDRRRRSYNGLYGCDGTSNPCWTDGRALYSYDMPIAWRDDVDNVKVADRETAMRPDGGGRGGISMTTRRHIDAVNWHLRKNSIEGVAWDVIRDHAAE